MIMDIENWSVSYDAVANWAADGGIDTGLLADQEFYSDLERQYSEFLLDDVLFGETVGEDEPVMSGTDFIGINFTTDNFHTQVRGQFAAMILAKILSAEISHQ